MNPALALFTYLIALAPVAAFFRSNTVSFRRLTTTTTTTMTTSKFVLAVDIDECLALFIPALAEFHNEAYPSSSSSSSSCLTAESFVSYEFHKVWGGSAAESSDKMTKFFASRHFQQEIKPVPGALESLRQLKEEMPQLELHCVTARQNVLEEQTRAWIASYFPGLFTDIHFGNHYSTSGVSRSKPEMCRAINAFALIDDSVVYAKQCAAAGIPVVLFGNYAWNQDIDLQSDVCAGRVSRATCWPSAVDQVRAVLSSGGGRGSLPSPPQPQPPPLSCPLLLASHLPHTTSPSGHRKVVAAVQLCSSHDKQSNLAAITRCVEAASIQGATLICLPEACLSLGRDAAESLALAEPADGEGEEGEYFQQICALAVRFQVWLSFCLAVKSKEAAQEGKMRNRHVLVNCLGSVVSRYDKVHLFDSPLAGLQESSSTSPGDALVISSETPFGKLGLSVCYDLRFPQLYAALADMGADLLLMPSAFTVPTGEAHWEVLLRARAIENQCYVVAAAQGGTHHPEKGATSRVSYGHTLVVDPWGRVLCQAEGADAQREGYILFSLDSELLRTTREKMPVLSHRRPHVYDA